MKSSAVMTRDVVVVAPTVTVGGAAGMMKRLQIRHLPVVESGRLVGILSDRDVLKASPDMSCGEAMTAAPVTCPPSASVSQVAAVMLEHKVDSIPIVGRSGTLVGLVTSTDLIALLVEKAGAQVLPFDYTLRLAATDGDALSVAA